MIVGSPKKFHQSEHGGLTVEAVLIIPILVWALTATFVFWDAFKTINVSQKATYTIADTFSRETSAINPDYMTATHELFDYLMGGTGSNALRVSVVSMSQDPITLEKSMTLEWSQGVGGVGGYTDLVVLQDRVPDMAPGDQLIVVESEQEWAPAFAVGLARYRFREVAISRPRFAPQLVWDAG
jgi:hypothetical protein